MARAKVSFYGMAKNVARLDRLRGVRNRCIAAFLDTCPSWSECPSVSSGTAPRMFGRVESLKGEVLREAEAVPLASSTRHPEHIVDASQRVKMDEQLVPSRVGDATRDR